MSEVFKDVIKKPMRDYAEIFRAGGTSPVNIRQLLRELAYESVEEVMMELRGCSVDRCADCNPANEGSNPSTPSKEE